MVFGSDFLGEPRDYSRYIAGDGPPIDGSPEPHRRGMALGGALLQARSALMDEDDLDDGAADDVLWAALCGGLPLLPHQGVLPNFCCVRRVVRDAVVPAALVPTIEDAFDDIGIASACPHVF